MNIRPAHLLFVAGVPICIAIPGFATSVTPTRAVQSVGPVRQLAAPEGRPPRYARLTHARSPLFGDAASGCATNVTPYFVGIETNYAGGGSDSNGYAGVVAGHANNACDSYSAILGGANNAIGGNDADASAYSVIAGGTGNSLNSAAVAFIGGGGGGFGSNFITSGAVYGPAELSAIVAGGPSEVAAPYSFIGGGTGNTVIPSSLTAPRRYGQSAFVGAGQNNVVAGNFSGILSGSFNAVNPDNSTVVGGLSNVIQVSSGGSAVSANSVIAGGVSNTIATTASVTNGQSAFIGAGSGNTVSANFASIVGGLDNHTLGSGSAIGGGQYNNISANASYAALAGGAVNGITGKFGAVGGGLENEAVGQGATIPGGQNNTAKGVDSFAAGTASNAATNGAFVWSDDASGATSVTATVANAFMARASGGFFLYSAPNLASGVTLAPGSGSWSSLSDRSAKTAIESVDDARILAKVAALPVSEWSYTTQGSAIRHMGPMAQDFRAAFGLGEDEKHISAVDEEGVALAAIKALHAENAALHSDNAALHGDNAALHAENVALRAEHLSDETRLANLERRLDALEIGK